MQPKMTYNDIVLRWKQGRGWSIYIYIYIEHLIPNPLVSEHCWLVKALGGFTVSRLSRAGGHDVAVAMRHCGISTTSQTGHVCKHRFSAIPIDKTTSVEVWIGLLWHHFCSSSYRVWGYCERLLGLDSDRWIPDSMCCENPVRAKALAGFSRHLSAEFPDLNPAPRGLSL